MAPFSLSLDGIWQLRYCPEDGNEPRDPQALAFSDIPIVEAAVPGNVELDLQRAGLVPDPYYGDNLYTFRKYEFYTWWYTRSFELPSDYPREALYLRFDGLDTCASIWCNGTKIGACENALIEHEFLLSPYLHAGSNTLQIHIASAVNRARQSAMPSAMCVSESYGGELLAVRKPPHCFGWDIAPRLPSAGIWRSVKLISKRSTAFDEIYLATRDAGEAIAHIEMRYRYHTDSLFLEGFSIRIRGICADSFFLQESRALFVTGKLTIPIKFPRLWWPRGYGEAALYQITVELLMDGTAVDTRTFSFGIRQAEVKRSYAADTSEFQVLVNHVPIMVKGANWVPLDCLHSRDAERLDTAHALLCDAGCNLVRCWGGNVYESDRFYDLCDREGILVWQDFAFACGIYDQSDAFAARVAEEARCVAIRLRNHACLLLWAGDNEVDQFYTNAGYLLPHARFNRISREVLPRTLAMHDPYREYLPSSPYLPNGVTDEYTVPEQHAWGPRDYFKGDFYKHSTAHFISEIGYHGCPSLRSLLRFLPKEELGDWDAPTVRTHSTDYLPADLRSYSRSQLMCDQVKTMFGTLPHSIEDFILASQISQAEAKKYFIESTRLKKWRRSGIIWWNLLDGWPQISDAVVDYYFEKKLAYSYICCSQQPICLMMDEPVAWQHPLVLANDSRKNVTVTYEVRSGQTGVVLIQGVCLSRANENMTLAQIPCIPGTQELYLLSWAQSDGVHGVNHYISGFVPFHFEQYCQWLSQIKAHQKSCEVCTDSKGEGS